MSDPVIQTNNLTKVYGAGGKNPFRALNKLNLTVEKGEIFGYLGPNGAGKTTTIRMLLDFIRPTEGKATVLGMDANAQSVDLHARIGYLPSELGLWKNEKAIDIVRYVGRMRGKLDMPYVNELADRLKFDLNKRIREYSTGNKRKLGLILVLMNRPELLILDEPTSGLDPLMQQEFNRMMIEFRESGGTVFLSSHLLTEVEAICDRVAVLRNGELQAVERVETLTKATFRYVTLEYDEPVRDGHRFDAIPGVSDVEIYDNAVKLRMAGDFDPLLRTATKQYVVTMDVDEPSLEEVFLAYYGDDSLTNNHMEARMIEKEVL